MIELLAQDRLVLDELILLTKQSFILGECLSQPHFSAPMPDQLPFVARNRATLTTFDDNNIRGAPS